MSLRTHFLSAIAAIAATIVAAGPAIAQKKGQPGQFDYYVLALSWSPAYCAAKGKKAPEQCGSDKNYGFVIHGLWPQYNDGGYPVSCAIGSKIPAEVTTAMLPVMPDRSLIDHEWQKHGTCSGLTPDDYFADTHAAYDRVRLPEMLHAPKFAFSMPTEEAIARIGDENPEFPAGAVVPGTCTGGKLSEIRVCLSKDLNPISCPPKVSETCSRATKLEYK